MQKSNYKKNSNAYIRNYILSYIFFPIAVWPLIYGKFLSFSQIGIIYGVSSFIQTILELPSGALADMIGRRNIIIAAKIIRFFSYIIIIYSLNNTNNIFILLLIGETFWKIAESFASGSEEALIYDSLKENNQENQYEKIESKAFSYYTVSQLLAALSGGFLYEIDFRLPFLAVLIPSVLSIVNAFFFEEPILDTKKYSFKSYLKQNILGFKHIFRHKIIFLISFYSIISITLYVLGASLLYQKSLHEIISIPKYVGIVSAFLYLSRAISSWIYGKIYHKVNKENFAILLILIQSISSFMLFIPSTLFIILGLIIRFISDGLRQPYITKIQNQYIQSKYRATAISAIALLISLIAVTLSPLVGYGIDIYNARIMIGITGFLSLFIGLPLAINLKRLINN